MGWLDGKIAWITGAGSGIGKAVLDAYMAEGAAGIVAFDRDEQRLEALRETHGDKIIPCPGDVRDAAANRRAVAMAVEAFGRLDIFVGNAGVRDGRRRVADLSDDALDAGFDEVMGINVKAYLIGAKAAQEALRQSRGCIVFTLSTSSFYIGGGSIYIASKHAALGLMRALAHEFAPDIRVNGVAPGGTPTRFSNADSLDSPTAAQGGRTGGPSSTLMQRQVEARDHAGAYVLLASDQSRVMTGTVIQSDGGRGVMLPQPQGEQDE